MSTKISTSEAAINQAYSTLAHNREAFSNFSSQAKSYIGGLYQKYQSLMQKMNGDLNVALGRLEQVHRRKAELTNERNQLARELAACRPPYYVTETYTDADGNTHSYTRLEDPDGPKRAALQAAIAAVDQKLAILANAEQQFVTYISRVRSAIADAKQAEGPLAAASNTLDRAERKVEDCNASITNAIRRAENALESYNSVNIEGSSTEDIGEIPYFSYSKGTISTTSSSSYSSSSSVVTPKPRGPITIQFDDDVESELEFSSKMEKIIEEHGKDGIILKIHKTLKNFRYPTNLVMISALLVKKYSYVQKMTNFGTKYVTVDGYYVYTRS